MTTALAAQLQQLAAITGIAAGKRPRGKPSLLYTYQEAADLGVDAIYAVGLQGFEQLCRLDARFRPFGQTLFGQANTAYVREQQTAEVNAKLDASVLSFCQLLSAYFLLPPSFKALEYLIRRYRVNEHNVDSLMLAALPYHSTNEFVRLVHVLRLEGGAAGRLWEFLAPMQQSGAAMPRAVLVQRCVNDRALLRFVCEMAQQLSGPEQAGQVAMPFYAVVLCETLAAMKTVNEELVAMLLPYLVRGLGPDVVPDYRAATHMILTQLASRAALSAELAAALAVELCRGPGTAGSLPQALMVLAHLAATQPHLAALPSKALKHLSKASGVAAELAALAEKGVRLGPLLGLLAKAAAGPALEQPGLLALLEDLVPLVPLGPAAAPLANALLARAAAAGLPEASRDSLLRVLRALELRYPSDLDAAVNAALSPGGEGGGLGEADRQRLFGLLERAFGGTARCPVAEAGTTLALALDAPSAAVREMALEKLGALSLEEEGPNPEMAAFVQTAALRRLQDDAPSVALAALRLGTLGAAPPGPLFDGLQACYHKAIRQVLQPGTKKSVRKEAREAAREALKQLSGPFCAANPAYRDRVALLALDALPAAPLTHKLPSAALKCAGRLDHALLSGLSAVKQLVSCDGPQSPQPKKTPKKKAGKAGEQEEPAAEGAGADAALNRGVVSELAKHVAAHPEAQSALLQLLQLCSQQGGERGAEAADGRRAELLLLAVACAALGAEGGASIAGDLLKLLLAHPPTASPLDQHTPAFAPGGLLLDESLAQLGTGALSLHAMHAALVFAALEAVPVVWLAQAGMEGVTQLFVSLAQQPHMEGDGRQLQVLVRRAAEALSISELLSNIFGLPQEAAPAVAVQVAALRMFALVLRTAPAPATAKPARNRSRVPSPTGPRPAAPDRPLASLLRLLAALSHPQRAVRAASVEAARALGETLDVWWSKGGLGAEGAEGGSAEGTPSKEQVQAVLAAVAAQGEAVLADADALEALVQRTLGGSGAPAPAAPPTTAKKGRGGAGSGGRKKAAAAEAPGASGGQLRTLRLGADEAEALGQLLLALLPAQRGPAGLHAAGLALRCVGEWAPPGRLLLAGWRLLRGLGGAAAGQQAQQEAELAAEVMRLYVPAAVSELLGRDPAHGAEVLQSLLGALDAAEQPAPAAVRLAAVRALGADLFQVLPETYQHQALVALLNSASRDPSEECRAAARAALAALPLAPSMLRPLLDISKAPAPAPEGEGGSQADAAPPTKRKRGAKGARAEPGGAEAQAHQEVDVAKLDLCVAALELLQWKDNLAQPLELVPALQSLLEALLRWQASAAAEALLPACGYAAQLALGALLSLAQRPGAGAGAGAGSAGFDLGLAVRCAQAAPSSALRNAALALVGALAAQAPADVLGHVLEVVGVVGRSAAMQADAQSAKVASQVLRAVVPAWVAGGGSLEEVVGEVVAAAPRIPSSRRLPVFAAVVEALPQVEGLCVAVTALLQRALRPTEGEEDEAEEADATWPTTLASDLLAKAPVAEQAAALAALLQRCMDSANQHPTEPLPMLATAFATKQLQLQAGRTRRAVAHADPTVAAGYQALMRAALLQLQRAGEMAAAEGRRREKKGKKAGRALEAIKRATEVTYKLLQALQHVMAPAPYLSALAQLVGSPMDKIRRRALALVAAVVKAAAAAEEEQGPAAAAAAAEGGEGPAGVAQAALAAVQPAVQLLGQGEEGNAALPAGHEPATAITRQAALATLGALAAAYGTAWPQPFLDSLPAVLAAAQDPRAAVRGSALAAVASIARALGARLVPALPATVRGVLAASHAAAAAVKAAQQVGGGEASSGEEEEEEPEGSGDEEGGGGKGASRGDASALELAAALAAISALVESLGAFLAPHLPALLGVLLAPAVLGCRAAHCADLAAAVRARLADAVPPRLLLGPLLAHLEPAVEAGAPAVRSLLAMATTAVGAMDLTATAAHHEAVFAFLLRALDLRRRRPAALAAPAQLDEVEAAAVAAFVALTLKLSEAQFKPLFLRLLDWADAPPPAEAEPAGAVAGVRTARGLALAALANALVERLRSVFVPYFRYLLDPFLAHLADGSLASPAATKKKKKKQKTEETAAGAAAGGAHDPLQVENDWRLRLQVIRALRRCLAYDSVGFLDEARFERLLPPLVAHLALAPPPAAAPALEALGAAEALAEEDGLVEVGEGAAELDVVGRAVVACLAQLGVTAGSDAQWKALNHQVLMASRSLDARTRLLALEAAAQLAGRLREEYLPLLPETLPFLAELLEDAEAAVEARAAAVLRWLEELSGESLAEYLKA